MTLHETLLILHLVGAFLIVAGAGIGTATGIGMSRTANVGQLGLLARMAARGERLVTLPGAVAAILFGSWLVAEADLSFGAPWLSAAYTLWIVAVGLSLGVMTPHARRVAARAAALEAQGVTESEELRAFAGQPRIAMTGNLLHLITLALIVVMVTKPGA